MRLAFEVAPVIFNPWENDDVVWELGRGEWVGGFSILESYHRKYYMIADVFMKVGVLYFNPTRLCNVELPLL